MMLWLEPGRIFQLSISNLNWMVGKYWSWYNCCASGRAHLCTEASTVWICACKSTDWWPSAGCSLQLQPPWRLRRTSSYARASHNILGRSLLTVLVLTPVICMYTVYSETVSIWGKRWRDFYWAVADPINRPVSLVYKIFGFSKHWYNVRTI